MTSREYGQLPFLSTVPGGSRPIFGLRSKITDQTRSQPDLDLIRDQAEISATLADFATPWMTLIFKFIQLSSDSPMSSRALFITELMVLHGLLALQKRYSFVRKVVESFVTLYFILDLCPQPLATVWKANGETFMQDSFFLIVALLAIDNFIML